MKPTEAAWLAGLFDGDGSLNYERRAYCAQSAGDAPGLPWVVELTEAGTRREWARYKAGEERTATGAKLP